MTLFARRELGDTQNQLVPIRGRGVGTVTVDADTALRSSAVWACQRLRADLLSTMPVGVYRKTSDNLLDVPLATAPLFIRNPANDAFGVEDWLYQTQFDLDRYGNTFGLIDYQGNGRIATVTPVAAASVRVRGKGSQISNYVIDGTKYTPTDVWHERQFTMPGSPLGLSPIAYAATSIGSYLSAQKFGVDWFASGSIPAGKLRNTARTITPDEAQLAKERFRVAVANRDLFVHGADWEFEGIQTAANESQFIETMNYGVQDIARFFGIPGDLIDAPAMSSAKITYANITQRHLQLLVMNLAPTIRRREAALTRALPSPQFVKFDTDSILRLDPQTQQSVLGSMVASRLLAPSEARAISNRMPFTDEQLAEFDRLFSAKSADTEATPTTTTEATT